MSESVPAAPRRIVAVGECMIELREEANGALSYAFAGDTLNVATYLRRLLPPQEFAVDYVTALGDDPLSQRMLRTWQDTGLGTDMVRRLEGQLPGLYWIGRRPDGERHFYYWRNASAARQLFRDPPPLTHVLSRGDVLYLSAISLAILPAGDRTRFFDLMAELRRAGVIVACDLNYRARLWSCRDEALAAYQRVLKNADIILTSFADEAELLADESLEAAAARLGRCEVAEWVIREAPGVTVTRADGLTRCQPVAGSTVVDTTGAGDAFDAAYLGARLMGFRCADAVRAGHALAGIVVQHRGAIVGPADTPSLDGLLSR